MIIDKLKENKPENSVVLSFDEKAKISIKEYYGNVYTKERKVYYPAKQKTKGLLEMPAAINIHTGKIHTWFRDWKNSFVVIDCFEDLIKKYPGKIIYVILDNWSAHKSWTIKIWAFFHPNFHLIYLPTNASWMNMIERVFGKLEREVLQNSNFQTVREAIDMISNYFDKEASFMNWCS